MAEPLQTLLNILKTNPKLPYFQKKNKFTPNLLDNTNYKYYSFLLLN